MQVYRSISKLAQEICGECVPRVYAPSLKESMDQIQDLRGESPDIVGPDYGIARMLLV